MRCVDLYCVEGCFQIMSQIFCEVKIILIQKFLFSLQENVCREIFHPPSYSKNPRAFVGKFREKCSLHSQKSFICHHNMQVHVWSNHNSGAFNLQELNCSIIPVIQVAQKMRWNRYWGHKYLLGSFIQNTME